MTSHDPQKYLGAATPSNPPGLTPTEQGTHIHVQYLSAYGVNNNCGLWLVGVNEIWEYRCQDAISSAFRIFSKGTLTQIPNVISHSASIWFENWEVMGPGLKTGVSWFLKVQHTEARSTGLKVSSLDFLFNIQKSFYFWIVTTLKNVFISHSGTL